MITRFRTIALALLLSSVAESQGGETPTFDKDVSPILKAHCYACHGIDMPRNGLDVRTRAGLLKGGKTALAVTPGSLRDSLLWTNIANDKMPAEATKLSEEQKGILRAWILSGAPGTAADVVRLQESPTTTGPLSKRGVEATARLIDAEIEARLRKEKIPVSSLSDDAEFHRRVYLDLTGRIPTVAKTVAFLDSKEVDKRIKLIDDLLQSPEYGRHFAVLWHKLLIPKTAEAYRRIDHDAFRAWLSDGFNANRGWDETVTALLSATGETPEPEKNGQPRKKKNDYPTRPETSYITGHFEDGRPQPRSIASTSSKLFLGVQIECAQCHNHPLARWKQNEFWGVAAFFERVRGPNFTPGIVLEPSSGKKMVYNEKGRYYFIPEVRSEPLIDVQDQGNKETGTLVRARFLGGKEPKMDANESYRAVYAKWMTSPENPYFARAAVNRMWAHLYGRGFVEPVDDMQEDSPPTYPKLLHELSREFAASGFDLKHLIRCIANSKTYQRSSSPLKENVEDKTLYSHQGLKLMTAEVLLESLCVAVPSLQKARTEPVATSGKNAGKYPFSVEEFLTVFESDETAPTEYSRGLIQALRLMNRDGRLFNCESLAPVVKEGATVEENVERIYLMVLSRRPTGDERKEMVAYVKTAANEPIKTARPLPKGGKTGPVDPYADIYWVLLNSSEFIFNH